MKSEKQENINDLDDLNLSSSRYQNRWSEEKWEQEFEEHPFFMSRQPDDNKISPLFEALQQLKFDENSNSNNELAEYYKEDGNQNFKLKEYNLAIKCYSKAIQLKPESQELCSILYANRSACNFHLENYRSSLKDALKAIRINKMNRKAYQKVINCYEKLKKYSELIEFCETESVYIDKIDDVISKAKNNLKLIERDERKNKAKHFKEKKLEMDYREKILNELSKNKIKTVGNIFDIKTSIKEKVEIKIDGNCLIFPVLIEYLDVNNFVLFKDFHQCKPLSEYLSTILKDSSDITPDLERIYSTKNILFVEYKNPLNGELIKIDINQPLIKLFQDEVIIIDSALIVCIKVPELEVKDEVGIHTKKKVEITLGDCLACSGCITSAETILIQQQNETQLYKILEENKLAINDKKKFVISLSLQAISSLAAKHELTFHETTEKLVTYFKSIGFDYVFDISFARHLALNEIFKEFKQNYFENRSKAFKTPILSSICPGFVCYAEKTHGELILPYLSKIKSPQQIFGSLLKYFWSKNENIESNKIYHVSFMPCYDKKLEASRKEFIVDNNHDVDMVLTPKELEIMMRNDNCDFKNLKSSSLDNLLNNTNFLFKSKFDCLEIKSHLGSGSGGYAENIFRFMSWVLKERNILDEEELEFKTKRNKDFLEIHLNSKEGINLINVAIVNGFRNIQTIIQRFKRKNFEYDYIEVMACPSGCLNGGGMLKEVSLEIVQKIYLNLNKHKFNFDFLEDDFFDIYEHWFNSEAKIKFYLHTTFNCIPKLKNPININW